MNEARPPTAEEQLAFLRSLQRLLDEGSFTASYKFALLHAIADLCVVKGDDSGAEFQLSTTKIAEQFIRLYWRQAAPYPASEEQHILSQNTGRQAAIVREVAKHRYLYQGSLADLESSGSDWVKLRRKVKYTVAKMPLNKLQNVGSEQLDFLYQIVDHGRAVRLKPGVTYCLRALYPMVTDMIEGAWLSLSNDATLGCWVRPSIYGRSSSSLNAVRLPSTALCSGKCSRAAASIARATSS